MGRKIGVAGHQLVRELFQGALKGAFPQRKFQGRTCLEMSREGHDQFPAHQFLSLRGVDKRTASEKVNCDCALPRLCFVHAFCFQVPGSES